MTTPAEAVVRHSATQGAPTTASAPVELHHHRRRGLGLVRPIVSSEAVQTLFDQLSRQIAPETHALLVIDRADWHCANDHISPESSMPIFLPPCL